MPLYGLRGVRIGEASHPGPLADGAGNFSAQPLSDESKAIVVQPAGAATDAVRLVSSLAVEIGVWSNSMQIPDRIMSQRWSRLMVPLFWAAAQSDDVHPIIIWLDAACGIYPQGFQVTTLEAWGHLCRVLRAWGVDSCEKLVDRIAEQGFGVVMPRGHITREAQEKLLSDAVEADSRASWLETSFCTAVLALALSACLAERARPPERVGQPSTRGDRQPVVDSGANLQARGGQPADLDPLSPLDDCLPASTRGP